MENNYEKAVFLLREAYIEHIKEKEELIGKYPAMKSRIEDCVKPWVKKVKEFLEDQAAL